jgi:hypothetical protein
MTAFRSEIGDATLTGLIDNMARIQGSTTTSRLALQSQCIMHQSCAEILYLKHSRQGMRRNSPSSRQSCDASPRSRSNPLSIMPRIAENTRRTSPLR